MYTYDMKYPLSREDFEKAFTFALQYHLDPKKSQTSRTFGATRGLGGVLDSFIMGKLVEIGVSKALKSYNQDKEYVLDLEIKNNSDIGNEPDIEKIIENGKERKPNCFIEIKNISASDRWVGLSLDQFKTIQKSSDPKSSFIIGAYIKNNNEGNNKQKDLLGIYLKEKYKSDDFKDFTEVENIDIEIEYVISMEELNKLGGIYKSGSFLYETEIFEIAGTKTTAEIQVNKINKIGTFSSGKLEHYKSNDIYPNPDFMGEFLFEGKIDLYEKINLKSIKRFIHCLSDVKITNTVLGNFYLRKNQTYFFHLGTVGRNPLLKRDNIWIAKRNIKVLQEKGIISSPEEVMKIIANKI